MLIDEDEKAAIELVCRWCMDYGIATGHANRLADVLDQIRLHGCQKALDAERQACADVCMRVAELGPPGMESRACSLSILARIGIRAK